MYAVIHTLNDERKTEATYETLDDALHGVALAGGMIPITDMIPGTLTSDNYRDRSYEGGLGTGGTFTIEPAGD